MTSSFQYANGEYPLIQLITPYATTTFSGLTNSTDYTYSMQVIEQGAHQGARTNLYLYVNQGNNMPTTYANLVPTTSGTGFSFPNTFDAYDSNLRNTFFWDPVQYALLPANFLQNLAAGSLEVANLYSNNYLQGRQQHWLFHTNYTGSSSDYNCVSSSLSLKREPSPDGVTQGQITWYDYAGKYNSDPEYEGSSDLISCVALFLPNRQSRFAYYLRNVLGFPTNTIKGSVNENVLLLSRRGYDGLIN
jgi:hypothetical protein